MGYTWKNERLTQVIFIWPGNWTLVLLVVELMLNVPCTFSVVGTHSLWFFHIHYLTTFTPLPHPNFAISCQYSWADQYTSLPIPSPFPVPAHATLPPNLCLPITHFHTLGHHTFSDISEINRFSTFPFTNNPSFFLSILSPYSLHPCKPLDLFPPSPLLLWRNQIIFMSNGALHVRDYFMI